MLPTDAQQDFGKSLDLPLLALASPYEKWNGKTGALTSQDLHNGRSRVNGSYCNFYQQSSSIGEHSIVPVVAGRLCDLRQLA